MRPEFLLLLLLLAAAGLAAESSTELLGHTKLNVTTRSYPDDSVFRPVAGANSVDLQGDLRLNLEWRRRGLTFDAAYQLVALNGDSLELTAGLPPGAELLIPRLPNDDRRLFDLTHVISDSADSALLHRLDRLWVGYAGEKAVIRFGRQALSWGNGLFYAPLDLVNPFDPATIDTEFKVGDDLLYGQYLRDNGDDIQAALVLRKNPLTGDVESGEATVAVKYHGFAGAWEFDVLAARSYGDPVAAIGGGRDIGGAVWRADVVITDTDNDTTLQFVSNLSYSWTLAGRNMSGAVEYFYNGFGQAGGDYDPSSLVANPDLLNRIVRGQLFTLGRHYLAASVQIEMTPLWSLTPVLLSNVADPSGLVQLTTNYSLGDNIVLLGSVNLPFGASGTEFGGIDSGLPGRYFATGPGVFAQIAWYF